MKEPRVHQVPIAQAGQQSDREHDHDDNLIAGGLGLSCLSGEGEQEESADDSHRRKRRQLQRVATGRQQFMPA